MASTAHPSPAPARMPGQSPQYTLRKDRHISTLRIGHWTIRATKRPILNGREIEAAEKSLNLPLPEMTFGNNSLSLTYDPSTPFSATSPSSSSIPFSSNSLGSANFTSASTSTSTTIIFDTLKALSEVAVGDGWEERVGGGVKVSMAETWGKSRSNPSALLSDVPLPSKPVKPHDWTYSTIYSGTLSGPSAFVASQQHSIPMSLLARQDPILDQILYYDDISLFEDELHDNGESILNVRIRVMPHSWFVLARLFLRVDNVLFRIYDVRLYHAFGEGVVIRDISGMEASYEDVKARLEKASDLSPLTDTNFVNGIISSMSSSDTSSQPGKPWPGLGRKVEVMYLEETAEQKTRAGLGDLAL